MERTLILLKPDAVQRGLIGDIVARFERKGLKIAALKLMQITPELAHRHYEAHRDKKFFPGLVKFVTSSPVVALAVEGNDVIRICRTMMGATFGAEAAPGTIRGDHGVSRSFNLVHGSDSPEAAARELKLFFPEGCLEYSLHALDWVYDTDDAR